MKERGKERMESWTCKKTAKPGDLYLFYFGEPECKIAGLAVCRESPDPEGWKRRNWTNRQKMFFCRWDALYHCNAPVTADEVRANRILGLWWATKPFRGRPKAISPAVANSLLQIIVKREPNVAGLLKGYIDERTHPVTVPKEAKPIAAWEGTLYERLAKQRMRSQELRDEKIRRSMDSKGHLICEVAGCGFDFLATYGELGRGFAHVHHRSQLAAGKRKRTKLADLAIVCANCHAMIHKAGQCRPLEGLISDD